MGYIRNIRFDKLQICCGLVWKYIYYMGKVANEILTMLMPHFMIYHEFLSNNPTSSNTTNTDHTINITNSTQKSIYIDDNTSTFVILLYILAIMICLWGGSAMYFRENKNFKKDLYNNAIEFVHSLDPYRRKEVTKMHLFVNKLKDYEPDIADMIYKISQN